MSDSRCCSGAATTFVVYWLARRLRSHRPLPPPPSSPSRSSGSTARWAHLCGRSPALPSWPPGLGALEAGRHLYLPLTAVSWAVCASLFLCDLSTWLGAAVLGMRSWRRRRRRVLATAVLAWPCRRSGSAVAWRPTSPPRPALRLGGAAPPRCRRIAQRHLSTQARYLRSRLSWAWTFAPWRLSRCPRACAAGWGRGGSRLDRAARRLLHAGPSDKRVCVTFRPRS